MTQNEAKTMDSEHQEPIEPLLGVRYKDWQIQGELVKYEITRRVASAGNGHTTIIIELRNAEETKVIPGYPW